MSNPEGQVRVVLNPGSHHSCTVAVPGHSKRVIYADPVLHIIPEGLETEVSIVPEDVHQLRVAPAAQLLLQVFGEVPVVQRDQGLDADLLQLLDQCPVVVGADFIVTPPGSVGKYPGPWQREPVVTDPQLLDGADVRVDVVVAVAAHVAGRHPAPAARKSVPDGETLPVLLKGALHLVGSGAHGPYEVFGEGVIKENLVLGIRQLTEATPRFQTRVRFRGPGGREGR